MASLRTRLGNTIRRLRAQAGLSQERFAHQVGLHRTYMGTLERGITNPTLEMLERIAAGLRLSLWELIREAETGRPPDSHPDRRGGPDGGKGSGDGSRTIRRPSGPIKRTDRR